MSAPHTLLDKLWSAHEIQRRADGMSLLWVDRHLVHEGSHHGFAKLAARGLELAAPELTFAVVDHYAPTRDRAKIADPQIKHMIDTLRSNAAHHGVKLFDLDDDDQGIVHVIGPEQGLTLPGLVINCGDSHTSTHGAFGALAFGIGATEVAHILATQTIWQRKPKSMQIRVEGALGAGVTAKDIALGWIAALGTGGARGHAVEYAGSAVRRLSMEGRMTLCNLMGAQFDRTVTLDAADIAPTVTWGTSPEQALPVTAVIPDPATVDPAKADAARAALDYMGLTPGRPLDGTPVDQVFIGSCTNGRIEDLRAAAAVLAGRKARVPGLIAPGSMRVKAQAEAEGLDRIFTDAGLEWSASGCSMCVGMNGDLVAAGKRCASSTNRNFRGRQGRGARTHLMSPAMVAAAAVTGTITDVRPMLQGRAV